MTGFNCRSNQLELMDQEGISFEEFHQCLQSLETINVLTLAYRPTLHWVKKVLNSSSKKTVHILDAGSGGGDMLRRIRKSKHSQNIILTGIDLNPWSKKSADLLSHDFPILYQTGDIFSFEPKGAVDIVMCSLFTHHLNDEQIVHFLRWIDGRAELGWFINDLHRHPVPYYFIKFVTMLFSRNRLIRHDAPISVARSFTKADWRRLLGKAGIDARAKIQWFFPFRICVLCQKT